MTKRVIQYTYTDAASNEKTGSIVFELPLRSGSRGLGVQVIKYFLGLGDISETSSEFDVIMENSVVQFQEDNRARIFEVGEYGLSSDALVDQVRTDQGGTEGDRSIAEELLGGAGINIDLPGGFLDERGQVGVPTFTVMMELGLRRAVAEFTRNPQFLSVLSEFGEASADVFDTRTSEQEPPKLSGDSYIYTYQSNITRMAVRDAMTNTETGVYVPAYFDERPGELQKIFREAVREVFDFYGKEKIWTVDAAERTFIPVVSPLQDAIDDGDLPRKLYEEILLYQRRVDTGFTLGEFKFTINEMDLNDQLNGDRVDVLFGQDLSPGAKPIFAGITEVIPPGNRPSDTFKIKINIRKDMFNQIRGGRGAADFGGTVDITDPKNIAAARDGFRAAKKFVNEDLGKPFSKDFWKKQGNSLKSGARKWASGQKMKAEKAAKDSMRNAWNKARTGQAGASDKERDENTESAIEAAKKMENNLINPGVYNVKELREHLERVSTGIQKMDEDIRRFEEENKVRPRSNRPYNRFAQNPPPPPPISPQVNALVEAKRVQSLINALEEFLDINGLTLKVGPNSKDKLYITFDEVRKEVQRPAKVNSETTPAVNEEDTNPLTEPVEVLMGHKIVAIFYEEEGKVVTRHLTAGQNLFTTKQPFIFPSTVSYLMSLSRTSEEDSRPEILKFLNGNPCRESQKIPAVIFLSRFHFPTPDIIFRTGKGVGINIGLDFDRRGLKAVEQHIKEQKKLASQSLDKLLESTFFEQKGRSIQTADVYPKFGELACNFEDMWRDFLDKWDPQSILCDYKKCVPGLEDLEFNVDFKWQIPTLPRLPTFNPLHFVMPQLKIALADLIMSFICEMVKNILEAISYPDCVDALQYGAALMSKLNDKNSNNPFADAQQKADLAQKTSAVLNNLGIPQDVLFGEDESSIEALFDAISLVLRPAELCDLLQGEASPGVLKIVLNVVRASNSDLKRVMTTIAEVSEFFRVLGQVVDPYLCDRLREIEEVVVADALCEEGSGIEGLRDRLERAGITSDEIAREMAAAKKRRDSLRQIAAEGNFDSLLPGNLPSDLKNKNLPGPYSNPHHDRLAKSALEAVLSNVKSTFNLEVPGIPEAMVDMNESLVQPGEPDFNSKDYLYFKYYSTQVINLEQELPARKAGKLIWKGLVFSPFAAMGHKIFMESIGIPEEELEYLDFYLEDNTRDNDAILLGDGVPEEELESRAQEFSDLIEKHVTDYITTYSRQTPEVFSKLKEISSQDVTTLTRKTSTSFGSPYRELHTRIATDVLELPLDNLDSKTNTTSVLSVGYSDMPFVPSQIKDCYRVSYMVGNSNFATQNFYFNKVYREKLPPEYIASRRESADIQSEDHIDKLLRPGGFADIYIKGLKEVSNNLSSSNLDAYENNSVRNHLSGFIKGNGGLKLDGNDDGDITGTERLVYLLSLLAQTAETKQDGFSIYEGFVDSFNYHLTDLVKNSRFFSYEEMFQLQQDISQGFKVENGLEGPPCYVPNPKLLDFDKIVEQFLNSYKNETEKPENDPTKRDFNEPGPFQTSTASGLFGLYVKFSCLEVIFKSMFLYSNFGPKGALNTVFMVDYILNYVFQNINNTISSTDMKEKVMKTVKKITKIEDENDALRSLIRKHIDVSSIEEFVTKLFESKYTSFDEKIRNEIVENAKEVPDVDNFPKLILRDSEGSFDNLEQQRQEARLGQLVYYLGTQKQRTTEQISFADGPSAAEQAADLREQAQRYRLAGNYRMANALEYQATQIEENAPLSLTIDDQVDLFLRDQREASDDIINNLQGYKEIPVSIKIPNIYDRFAFEGYSEELIQKKINSGHFWMEKFYRIKNFPEFFRLYSDLVVSVNSDDIFQNLQDIGTTPDTSLYSEYISPSDLDRLLFGSEDTDSREEFLQTFAESAERNKIEYNFVREFYLKGLNNFFAGRSKHDDRNTPAGRKVWHGSRFQTSAAVIDMMLDIGMGMRAPADIAPAPRNDRRGVHYGLVSFRLDYGSNWGDVRELPERSIGPIAPTDEVITELDYAYRSGAVTKQQLVDRVIYILNDINAEEEFNGDRRMLRNWDNNIPTDAETPGAIVQNFARRFEDRNSDLKFYHWLGRHFAFTQEAYSDSPGYQYKDIPVERKAELIVNCLTNMMDMIHNWPLNTNNHSGQVRTKVWWRTEPRQGRADSSSLTESFANNESVRAMFAELTGTRRSIDYLTTWYYHFRGDPNYSMVIDTDAISQAHSSVGPSNASIAGTPLFDGSSEMQSKVLDYYISRAYTNTLDQSKLSSSRTAGGALSIMKPAEWWRIDNGQVSEISVNQNYVENIIPKQQALYDFLKGNLQVGGRLMMGQKVNREYERPPVPPEPGSNELSGLNKVTTAPDMIFRDFVPKFDQQYEMGTATNRNAGLTSDRRIFNKKKCFLAYADSEDLVSENNPTGLNYKSAFYSKAAALSSNSGLGSAQVGERVFDTLIDKDIENVLVYSIPIHEYIEDVKCLDDVYVDNYGNDPEDPLFFPMAFETSREEGQSSTETEFAKLGRRREIIKSKIYEASEDSIVSNLLSLGPINRSIESRNIIEGNPMHPANVIFDILFPLDRYVGMHTIQNNLVFDKFRDDEGLFTATKIACLGLMGITGTAHDVTQGIVPELNVDEMQVESEGKTLGDYWRMFYKLLLKLLEQSYARLVRTIGEKADPGYRDMKKTYKQDPCDMFTGLETELLGGGIVLNDYDGNLQDGFGMIRGKKKYVSVNHLPVDILASIFKPSEAVSVARHLRGTITGKGPRYGYPVGLFGHLALSSPQLTAELLGNIKQTKQCENPGAQEPEGLCEDKEEQ